MMPAHPGQTGITITYAGGRLLGTLFEAPGEFPKPTALLLHGIPGIEKNYDIAHSLRNNGCNALIFHYRGCWGSSGKYNVLTIPRDVAAAIAYLRSGTHARVDPDALILIGHSLGGWAAILAAAADERIRAAAVIAPVASAVDFPLDVPEYASGYTPWLTDITPEELAAQWAALTPDLDPVKQVHRIAPRSLLIIHSAADEEVQVRHSRLLAERAGAGCRYLETIAGDHAFTWQRPWLQSTLLDWIRSLNL